MAMLRQMLLKAAAQFLMYSRNHMEKLPPQLDKAEVNRDLAMEITDILAADPDTNHQAMVVKLKKPGEAILGALTPAKADALHMALGISGEAGELADAIKKWAIYGKDLDYANVVEELGDLEFLMEGLRQICGIAREETLTANMAKLGVRYAGFNYSDAAAIARADKETTNG